MHYCNGNPDTLESIPFVLATPPTLRVMTEGSSYVNRPLPDGPPGCGHLPRVRNAVKLARWWFDVLCHPQRLLKHEQESALVHLDDRFIGGNALVPIDLVANITFPCRIVGIGYHGERGAMGQRLVVDGSRDLLRHEGWHDLYGLASSRTWSPEPMLRDQLRVRHGHQAHLNVMPPPMGVCRIELLVERELLVQPHTFFFVHGLSAPPRPADPGPVAPAEPPVSQGAEKMSSETQEGLDVGENAGTEKNG